MTSCRTSQLTLYGIRPSAFDVLMLEDAHLLGNHVELFVRLHTNLNECMAFMRTELLCFLQFVSRDFTWRTRGKALVSALAASMAC